MPSLLGILTAGALFGSLGSGEDKPSDKPAGSDAASLTLKQTYIAQALAYLSLSPLPTVMPASPGADLCAVLALQDAHEHILLPDQQDPLKVGRPPKRTATSLTWDMPLTPEQALAGQKLAPLALSLLPTATPASLGADGPMAQAVVAGYHDLMLQGAVDREPFLVEDPGELNTLRAQRDADARYYLIQLTLDLPQEELARQALHLESPSRTYLALRQTPGRYRGQVIHLEGELRKLNYFEMQRPVPGAPRLYQGWIAMGSPKQVCCVLFSELPPDFPPEKDWNQLSVPVQFDGYFLKVLKAGDAQTEPNLFPVLVGKTVQTPASTREWGWTTIIFIAFVTVVVGGLCCMGAWSWYRRSEQKHAAKMAELRLRRAGLKERLEVAAAQEGSTQEAGNGAPIWEQAPETETQPTVDQPDAPHRNGSDEGEARPLS